MALTKQRKIGVFSHGGTRNLGDEALLAAVVQNVRARVPNAAIVAFTINPDDTQRRHGITSFPIRRIGPVDLARAAEKSDQEREISTPTQHSAARSVLKSIPGLRFSANLLRRCFQACKNVLAEPGFLLQSYERLKGVELLLVAGSQQLNDGYGGAWGFPYTLFKWVLLSRLTKTKVAILSVGAGPINSRLSRFFIRRVLAGVSYRSYRDEISSRLMTQIGSKGQHPVFPDLVYSLRLPAPRPAPATTERAVVGTNPVPFFDGRYWPTSNPELYRDYVRKFARFAEWLDKNGRAVLFFPTQVRADTLTIQDIRQEMNGSSHSPNVLEMQKVQNLEDLVSEISRADFVIANRYHGILISLMMNKPVLGVAYHEKSRALLEQVGQGEFVVNIADFTTNDLIYRYRAMESNAPAVKSRIAANMDRLRCALEEQYDAVFDLIGIVHGAHPSTSQS